MLNVMSQQLSQFCIVHKMPGSEVRQFFSPNNKTAKEQVEGGKESPMVRDVILFTTQGPCRDGKHKTRWI